MADHTVKTTKREDAILLLVLVTKFSRSHAEVLTGISRRTIGRCLENPENKITPEFSKKIKAAFE